MAWLRCCMSCSGRLSASTATLIGRRSGCSVVGDEVHGLPEQRAACRRAVLGSARNLGLVVLLTIPNFIQLHTPGRQNASSI